MENLVPLYVFFISVYISKLLIIIGIHQFYRNKVASFVFFFSITIYTPVFCWNLFYFQYLKMRRKRPVLRGQVLCQTYCWE